MIALLWKATGADEYIVPRDLREGRGADAARRLSQELIETVDLANCWKRGRPSSMPPGVFVFARIAHFPTTPLPS